MYEEDQETINEKVKQARENNLGVIYCVGESKEEKEQDRSLEVISNQLNQIKDCMDQTGWKKVAIAYEPIWALNTGKISS